MKQTILIVDDDEKLNRLLEKFLGDFGMAVQWAVTPSAGLKLLKETPPGFDHSGYHAAGNGWIRGLQDHPEDQPYPHHHADGPGGVDRQGGRP